MKFQKVMGILLIFLGSVIALLGSWFLGLIFVAIGCISLARGTTAAKKQKQEAVPVYLVNRGKISEISGSRRIEIPSWVVLDVETTGLSAEDDRVIELAARKFENGVHTDTFSSLINPGRSLPAKVTEITGITDSDLRSASGFGIYAQRIASLIGDLPVVAHNAKFDAEFVVNELARAGITKDLQIIDTVKLAREAFPGMENYKLATLISGLGLIDHAQDHRALSDVDAAAALYLRCREELPKKQQKADVKAAAKSAGISREVNERADSLVHLGQQYEAEKKTDLAKVMYAQAVAEGTDRPHPYRRLAIIFRKEKNYEEEIRVCQAAVQTFSAWGSAGDGLVEEFQKRIDYAQAHMEG